MSTTYLNLAVSLKFKDATTIPSEIINANIGDSIDDTSTGSEIVRVVYGENSTNSLDSLMELALEHVADKQLADVVKNIKSLAQSPNWEDEPDIKDTDAVREYFISNNHYFDINLYKGNVALNLLDMLKGLNVIGVVVEAVGGGFTDMDIGASISVAKISKKSGEVVSDVYYADRLLNDED